jgi:exo-beta-1,3-glucanase (GH17 family)
MAQKAINSAQFSSTRRSVLTASAAIAGTGLIGGPAAAFARQAKASTLPLVRPMSSQMVQQNWGVCDHPNFSGAYQNRAAVIDRLAGMRVSCIRGLFTTDTAGAQTTASLRANGMTWVMTVYPTEQGMTTAALVARIRYIGDHAADVCRAVEGPNEWDNSRTGGTPMTAAATAAVQKTIYQTVRSDPRLDHVVVLGPACHEVVLENNNGSDYLDLVAAGIKPHQDAQAVHSYPAGSNITTKLAQRLAWVYAAFGDQYPVQITETGWTTAGTTGHALTTEADAATFAAQGVLIMAGLKIPTMRYEVLDDSPMGGADGFGLWSCSSTDDTSMWRSKPEVTSVGTLLRQLLDPGVPYIPATVRLKIVGAVERAITGKRNGVVTAWLWVTGDSPVVATVTDRQGTRSFSVTKELTQVPVRRI